MKTSQFIYIQIIVMDKNKYKVIYIGGGESEAKELGKYKKEGYGGVSFYQPVWPLWLQFWMF